MPSFTTYDYENFFYQGFNGNIGIYRKLNRKSNIGLMLIYRNWWHDSQWIYQGGVPAASIYSYKEKKSSSMTGFGLGVEYLYDCSVNNWDFGFFANISCTRMNGAMHVTEGWSPPPNNTIPRVDFFNFYKVNASLGVRIGYRKKLK